MDEKNLAGGKKVSGTRAAVTIIGDVEKRKEQHDDHAQMGERVSVVIWGPESLWTSKRGTARSLRLTLDNLQT